VNLSISVPLSLCVFGEQGKESNRILHLTFVQESTLHRILDENFPTFFENHKSEVFLYALEIAVQNTSFPTITYKIYFCYCVTLLFFAAMTLLFLFLPVTY